MTVSASHTKPLSERLPHEDERECANRLRQILAAQMASGGDVRLQLLKDKKPTEITLHPTLSEFLMEVLRIIGAGDAVTLMPVHQRLTTQQAADVLNVSRPYLIKLLEQNEMEFERVGRHRRVLARDVFAYKQKMAAERESALSEMAEADADLI